MQNFTIIGFLKILAIVSILYPSTSKVQKGGNNNEIQCMETIDTAHLEMNFELSYVETSKGSSSETTKIEILDRKVLVSKKYHGSKSHKDEHFEKKLNDITEKKLINFLNSNNFYVNYQETKDIKGIGISGHLSIEIRSPYNSDIKIDGKTNIWGSDDYVRKQWGEKYVKTRTNIEKVDYFIFANQFIALVKSL
jgi:hypothetical protein